MLVSLLEDALESPQQASVLAFFLAGPPRGYSVKELSKRLHMQSRKLGQSLNHFEKLSVLEHYTKARADFFIINRRHKLLPQIKEKLKKDLSAYNDELTKAILSLGQIKGAYLSGIFSGNTQSPIDILIVGKVNKSKLASFLESCSKMAGVEVNYCVMDMDEFVMRRDTYDRFLKDIFDYYYLTLKDANKSKITIKKSKK